MRREGRGWDWYFFLVFEVVASGPSYNEVMTCVGNTLKLSLVDWHSLNLKCNLLRACCWILLIKILWSQLNSSCKSPVVLLVHCDFFERLKSHKSASATLQYAHHFFLMTLDGLHACGNYNGRSQLTWSLCLCVTLYSTGICPALCSTSHCFC